MGAHPDSLAAVPTPRTISLFWVEPISCQSNYSSQFASMVVAVGSQKGGRPQTGDKLKERREWRETKRCSQGL